jgi:hypothetical protein
VLLARLRCEKRSRFSPCALVEWLPCRHGVGDKGLGNVGLGEIGDISWHILADGRGVAVRTVAIWEMLIGYKVRSSSNQEKSGAGR